MTFEQWWIEQHGCNWNASFSFSERNCAEDAWGAATKIENERCVKICLQYANDFWNREGDSTAKACADEMEIR